MSYFKNILLDTSNAAGDAFGRLRVSEPETLFDSKQINDNQPLLWDEELESGAGITSSWSQDEAATKITSTATTAGVFTRQTFMRFNYQPGKSQLIFITGNMRIAASGTGVEKTMGIIDDENGIAFVDKAGTMNVRLRSNYTGSPVDTDVAQSSWNYDVMDGTGPSKKTPDWTKSQIFVIDFEWLSVGQVRLGIVLSGKIFFVHKFDNAGTLEGAYMSTPNLPLRYQLVTTASSPATTMSAICASVISEGGSEDLGVLRYRSNEGTHVDCNTANSIYALVGIRLKSAALGTTIKLISASLLAETNDNFEWLLILNGTVAGTFTFADLTNSAVQTAVGSSTNTVTGGTIITGGYGTQNASLTTQLNNAIRLGADISGTVDEIVLCARPLAANADISGALTWREIS